MGTQDIGNIAHPIGTKKKSLREETKQRGRGFVVVSRERGCPFYVKSTFIRSIYVMEQKNWKKKAEGISGRAV